MAKVGGRQRLITVFVQELQERTASMERNLLALEKADDDGDKQDLIREILRAVHSLKGAAHLVEIASIETVCHLIEELLARSDVVQRAEIPSQHIQLLLECSDALADMASALAGGSNPPSGRLKAIANQLNVTLGDFEGQKLMGPRARHSPDQNEPAEETSSITDRSSELAGASPSPVESGSDAEIPVSVPGVRLDRLLNQSGELLLARTSAAERLSEAARLIQLVSNRRRRWRADRLTLQAVPGLDRSREAASDASRAPLLDEREDLLLFVERSLKTWATNFGADYRKIEKANKALDLEVRSARLQSFASAIEGLQRLVRDLAGATGKRVDLHVEGGQVEIDRSILQELRNALRHLVRNAVDHGIETVEERVAAGKPEAGQIQISARYSRDRINISVSDDGRGLAAESIRRAAQNLGISAGGKGDPTTDLIFAPGLTTAKQATRISGRGVGLDSVRSCVEAMRGSVAVKYGRQIGTTFRITVPLTVGTMRAIIVRCGNRLFALDSSAVRKLSTLLPEMICTSSGARILMQDGEPRPLLNLPDWLGLQAPEADTRARRVNAVELNDVGGEAVLEVNEIIAERELLIRPLGRRLRNNRTFSGASVLPDGTITFILNAAALGQAAMEPVREPKQVHRPGKRATNRRILIADDSITTRTLEKSILEGAGYEIRVAADGLEAWHNLETHGADLVLADVDMPGLDGFALTERMRQSAKFRDLPIVLLTARETPEDREKGLKLGADAYLIKSAFDQRELLRTIGQLL